MVDCPSANPPYDTGQPTALMLRVPIMACNLELEKPVFEQGAIANVVDDERNAGFRTFAGYQADVRYARSQLPGDDIARQKCLGIVADGQALSMPLEKGRQIRDPAVIDVLVGGFQAPGMRILVPGFHHVLMNQNLQVYAELAVSANDNIRADAAIHSHIAAGISQLLVTTIVVESHADLGFGGIGQVLPRNAGEEIG